MTTFSFRKVNGQRREVAMSYKKLNLGYHTETETKDGKIITNEFTVEKWLGPVDGWDADKRMFVHLISNHSKTIDNEPMVTQTQADLIESVIDEFNAFTEGD